MPKEMVLIVEDEEDILELVKYNLEKEGYRATGVSSGEQALKKIKSQAPDLILLDIMLPGADGLEICKSLKKDPNTSQIPIVMLTAKGEESDVVTGLELGAHDYITKPFSPRVLVARVRAVLRRRLQEAMPVNGHLKVHDLVIHPGRHEVLHKGKPLKLTVSEFRILQFLARRPGWVFTRNQIVEGIRGTGYPVTDRAVDVQIVSLRRKLGSAGQYIETVRGIGYRFKE